MMRFAPKNWNPSVVANAGRQKPLDRIEQQLVSNHTLGVAMRTTMKKEAAAKWSQSRGYARKDLGKKIRQLH